MARAILMFCDGCRSQHCVECGTNNTASARLIKTQSFSLTTLHHTTSTSAHTLWTSTSDNTILVSIRRSQRVPIGNAIFFPQPNHAQHPHTLRFCCFELFRLVEGPCSSLTLLVVSIAPCVPSLGPTPLPPLCGKKHASRYARKTTTKKQMGCLG